MSCRNTFPGILITMSLLFQGCGNRPVKYMQTYYDKTLKESEISWITIGNVYDENNEPYYGVHIEVMFDGLPDTYTSHNFRRFFAFPVGNQTLHVKAIGVSKTGWVELQKSLEGGKCYVINDRVDEAGLFSLASDLHNFRIEDTSCSRWFSGKYYDRVELYRLQGQLFTSG